MYLSNFHDSFPGQWNSCITFIYRSCFCSHNGGQTTQLDLKHWRIRECWNVPSLQSLRIFQLDFCERMRLFFETSRNIISSLDDHLSITTNVSLLIRHPGMYLWMYLYFPIRSIPPCFVLSIYLDNSVHLYFQHKAPWHQIQVWPTDCPSATVSHTWNL